MKVYAYLIILGLTVSVWACQPSQQATEEETAAVEKTEEEAAPEKPSYPADSMAADGSASFHGFRIDEGGVVSSEEALAMLAEKGEITGVKVSGNVDQVCQMRGCWMDMSIAEGEQMHVRFKDYGFFVPKDASGKIAIVEGRLYADTVSVADMRHKAEDGGMDPEEAAKKYTEPQAQLAFEATGVIIKDQEGK
ncbi:MAG: DUF4920 domain-containing protein [Bacteroidota bacterium]